MNGYNNNGTRRFVPMMVMPNGQVFFWAEDVKEQKPHWPEASETTRRPQAEDCPEEQTKAAGGRANARSLARA